MKGRFTRAFINIGLATGMSISLILGVMHLLELRISYLQVFVIACIIQCFYMIIFFNTKVCIAFSSFLSVGVGVLYLGSQKRWAYVTELLLDYLRENIFQILLMSSIALIVYLLTYKCLKKNILIGMGIILYSVIIFKDITFNSLEVGFLLLMTLLYCFYDYFLNITRKEEGTKEMSRSYFKMIFYLSTLTLGLAVFASYRAPIKFMALHRILDQKEVAQGDYAYSQYYPYSGILGGDIVLTDEEVLEVMSSGETYLKADSKSIYTGSYWTNLVEEHTPMDPALYEIQDTVEMLKGMPLLTEADEEKLYSEQSFRISFKKLLTQSLFIPIKSDNMALSQDVTTLYKKNEDTLLLGKAYGEGFTYSMHAYIPEYNTQEFKTALNRSKRGIYAASIASGKTGKLSKEDLEKWHLRSEEIYETFTQLPEDLPDRVKTLAYEITKDYESDYDKARALESYLAGNYNYSLSPGEPTKGRDFVDEFLFDNKKGYCTYFATAMAVLSRCIGLPSRYVEGYSMAEAYEEGMKNYTITNRQAHAWTEVYFEGFGWMTFEPTARYQSSFRNSPSGAEDSYYKPAVVEDVEVMTNEEPTFSKEQNKVLYSSVKKTLFAIGGTTFGMVMLVIGYRSRKVKKLLPRPFIVKYYEDACSRLAKKGLKLEKGETELTFARRVDEKLNMGAEEKVSFVEMTKRYLMVRYSENEINEGKKEEMHRLYTSLKKALKGKMI